MYANSFVCEIYIKIHIFIFYVWNVRLESYDRNENYCNPPVILPPTVLPNWPDSGFRQILPAHRSCLPKLLEGHITGYFRYRSACDDQANGDITALEKGKILFEANRVHTCSFCSTDSDTFFSGIVRAMMKKKVSIVRDLLKD